MVVLHGVELVWFDFWTCSPHVWPLIYLVTGILPLRLMLNIWVVVFLVHFRLIFYLIPTCVPVTE